MGQSKQQIILKRMLKIPVLKRACPLLHGENLVLQLSHRLQAPPAWGLAHLTHRCEPQKAPGVPAGHHLPSLSGSQRVSQMKSMASLRFLGRINKLSTPILFKPGLNQFLNFVGVFFFNSAHFPFFLITNQCDLFYFLVYCCFWLKFLLINKPTLIHLHYAFYFTSCFDKS